MEEVKDRIIYWESLSFNQKIMFALLAESNHKTGIVNEYAFSYKEKYSEVVLLNLNKFKEEPKYKKRSVGGLVSGLNKKGLTSSDDYTAQSDRSRYGTREERLISVTEKGKLLIENHFDVIDEFIKRNNIECLNY